MEPNRHKDEKIFAWVQKGSKAIAGSRATYTIFLWSNGGMTCDCPGWMYQRKKTGGCKHTKLFEDEGKELFAKYQRGEQLPVLEEEAPDTSVGTTTGRWSSATGQVSNKPKTMTDTNSRLKYGRFIEID